LNYSVRRIETLADVSVNEWNRLAGENNPFTRHEFLTGLERHDCLANHGWYPCHLLITDNDRPVAALPLYLKSNSIGEFVFDWEWAEAYESGGGHYYPKLVSAIPFTPVTGPRYLIAEGEDTVQLAQLLHDAALEVASDYGLSGLHILFPDSKNRELMKAQGMLTRKACQYHWFNHGYASFEDYLGALTSKRRRQIRKERRSVVESDIRFEILRGSQITDRHWEIFHRFYSSTFHKKWGSPRLTLPFFKSLSNTMPESTLLFMANHAGRYIAGAFAMQGSKTLYGRHWGCSENFKFLHFELCYYQTIDFCIVNGLDRLDAGAQGEHKINRGFVPVDTWSAHWFADHGFSMAIERFLGQERLYINNFIRTLENHSAYKQAEERI